MGFPLSTSPCWAPGRVGSTLDEYFYNRMASTKSYKRLHSDSEAITSIYPHFIVLESLQEKQLSKLNPFVVEKVISDIVKPVLVKKLQNGTLLVEVSKKTYADNLLKMNLFAGLKIKAYPHLALNTSKGVVRSSDLSLCTKLRNILKIKQFHTLNESQSIGIKKQ